MTNGYTFKKTICLFDRLISVSLSRMETTSHIKVYRDWFQRSVIGSFMKIQMSEESVSKNIRTSHEERNFREFKLLLFTVVRDDQYFQENNPIDVSLIETDFSVGDEFRCDRFRCVGVKFLDCVWSGSFSIGQWPTNAITRVKIECFASIDVFEKRRVILHSPTSSMIRHKWNTHGTNTWERIIVLVIELLIHSCQLSRGPHSICIWCPRQLL